MFEKKKAKLIFMLFSVLCFVAIGVCLICDLVINKNLSWSLYVLLSVVFGWIVVIPLLLITKDKASHLLTVCVLAALTVLTIPYLFLLEKITPVKSWFGALGMPIAIVAILAIWISYVAFKFLKINKWFKCSLLVFLFGAIFSAFIDFLVARFVGSKLFTFDNILSFITMLLLAGLLFYIGRSRNLSDKTIVPESIYKEEKTQE